MTFHNGNVIIYSNIPNKYMKNKILAELEFGSIINEVQAQTQTGAELINKYKAFLMANESTFALVNNFIKEAQNCRYDNGVNYI